MKEVQELAELYVSVWNETNPEDRCRIITKLWVPDGLHYVNAREARGHEALEARVIGSHEKNVRDGGYSFKAVNGAKMLRDVVTFGWEMISPAGAVVAIGLEFLIVDDNRRILVDYQFIQ
jgi:hypothetical protein